LSITDAAKPAAAIEPIGITTIDTAARADNELGVLDMKRGYPFVIPVDETEIVQVLMQNLDRILENFGPPC
jgi:hypothetical protein